MYNASLHRFAILVALFALVLIGAGAWLSNEVLPLPGSQPGMIAVITDVWAPLARIHRVLGDTTGTLTLVLAIWLTLARGPGRNLGWLAVIIVVAEAFLAIPSALRAYPRALGMVHALLAPVYLSVVAAIIIRTSRSFISGPELTDDTSGMLRKTALWLVGDILLQILLGASYRYNVLGVIWHILNAMIVLLLLLMVGVIAIRQYPDHRSLRPAAHSFVGIGSVQVLLGFATFLILLMVSQNTPALVVVSAVHITVGALTLAAGVVTAIQIRRNIRERKSA